MLLAFVFEEYSHQTKSTVCDDDILAVAQGRPDALHILYEKTAKSVYALTLIRKEHGKTYIEEAEKTDPTAFSGVENTEQRLLLKATLDTLNNDERQIVMLKAVAGMKAREIGKVLEIPLNTVLSKYHRALKKMRLYIEKEDGR